MGFLSVFLSLFLSFSFYFFEMESLIAQASLELITN